MDSAGVKSRPYSYFSFFDAYVPTPPSVNADKDMNVGEDIDIDVEVEDEHKTLMDFDTIDEKKGSFVTNIAQYLKSTSADLGGSYKSVNTNDSTPSGSF